MGHTLAALGIANILVDVSDFGGSQSNLRNIHDRVLQLRGFSEILLEKFSLFIAMMAIAFGLSAHVGAAIAFSVVLYVTNRSVFSTLSTVAQSQGKYALIAGVVVFDRSIALIVGIFMVFASHLGSQTLFYSYIIGTTAGNFALFSVARLLPLPPGLGGARFWRLFFRAPALGFGGVVTDLIFLETTIVQVAAGARAAGLFGLPSRLISPIATLTTNLARAAFPVVVAADGVKDAARSVLRAHAKIGAAIVVAILVGLVVGPGFLTLLVGKQYASAGTVLRLYLFASLFVFANQYLAMFFIARGLERITAPALVTEVFLGLGLAYVGASTAGYNGAGIGYLTANILLSCYLIARCGSLRGAKWRKTVAPRRHHRR